MVCCYGNAGDMMLRRMMMGLRPEVKLYTVDVLKRDDGKADVQFVCQCLKKEAFTNEGFELKAAGLVWSTKPPEDVPLIVDGEPNPDLPQTMITAANTNGTFSVTVRGLPAGMFIRGRVFATILCEQTNETYTIFSEEKTGRNDI